MSRILFLPGDGIGPEIVTATRTVLGEVSTKYELGLTFEEVEIGFASLAAHGTTMPNAAWTLANEVDGIILGPVSHNEYPPVAEGGLNPSAILRTGLDLFANIRPARTRRGLPSTSRTPFDLVIFRENTEGFYADRNMAEGSGEIRPDKDMALAIRKVTRSASARIAEAAFSAAMARDRKRVTAVHKANVLRVSDGLFLEETRRLAARHPEITYEELLVDAAAAHLVREPDRFDVMVTTNMFGDILSDLASELSGSLGVAPSLNAGLDRAMAQAQHGSAPSIAGKGIANPASLIGSSAMLLHWIAQRRSSEAYGLAAERLEYALETALSDPRARTPDLGGNGTTQAFADHVVAHLIARRDD